MSGNGNGHGNGGIDIAAVYGLLQTMAAQLITLQRETGAIRHDITALKLDTAWVKAELVKKADKDDVASLRQAVTGYHASVVGHGILITELDERLRRVERRLELGAPQ